MSIRKERSSFVLPPLGEKSRLLPVQEVAWFLVALYLLTRYQTWDFLLVARLILLDAFGVNEICQREQQ